MNYTEKGSRSYLFSIVLVAVLGGLLFGYDTAVFSGAEKGLQAFFIGSRQISSIPRDLAGRDIVFFERTFQAVLSVVLYQAFLLPGFGRKLSFTDGRASCSFYLL